MKKDEKMTFEDAMDNLEKIVEELEKGELPLDEQVEKFKKGVDMSNYCEKLLDEAEKSITILVKDKDGEVKEEDFSL
jgi:exodeoxyribonuclease VII small subunit